MARPGDDLEQDVAALWEEVLGVEPVARDRDFFELGGDAGAATAIVDKLQKWLGDYVYTTSVYDAPTVALMVAYLETHYPEAVARRLGRPAIGDRAGPPSRRVGREAMEVARRMLVPAAVIGPPAAAGSGEKKRRAVFVLSAPRAGSTLLRVMLAGHPALFAPPELNLLPFRTLAQRREACSGRHEFMLEGAIRAVMELQGCDAAAAEKKITALEEDGKSVAEFYGLMQGWLGERTLVDKSTSYALESDALKRVEAIFDEPLYIHLLRHPCGAIRSFEQVHFDRLFFRGDSPFTARELGEVVWSLCNENILTFLEGVPGERQCRLRFEDLVGRPEASMVEVSRFLGVDFNATMLEPYGNAEGRMTDGIYGSTRMQGDPRFLERSMLTPEVADAWKADYSEDDLGDPARAVAAKLGYLEERLSVCHGPVDDSLDRCCLHELFERQVELNPEATAAVCGGEELSYGELNARANRLANRLQELGVRPEVMVGLGLERSLEMLVGLLGILKAGGAYVPLDPDYPEERLKFMLEDCRPPVLVTQPGMVSAGFESETVFVEEGGDGENPDSGVNAENLAYVMYTSGSTGRPKGVLVPHRGATHVVSVQIREFEVEAESRVLQFASLSFDTSVVQIFMALGAGATLCMAGRRQESDVMRLMQEKKVTHADLPPSVLAVLPEGACPDLRVVSTGGERCPGRVVERWAPGRQFFNAYGPTEATICSTLRLCEGSYPDGPPIGKPIANTAAYVLDAEMKPVPAGVPGELYLGGVGLARGYLNRPDLTAERFVPNPFDDSPGDRLYKTGDVVRCRADGDLVFVGRTDDQVQIRGYRVEPGEVEAMLRTHASVREAAVIPRENPSGELCLVAYVASDEDEAGLRRFLNGKLPAHMVPAACVLLPELPRTAANKLDRESLPTPEWSRRRVLSGFVAPTTPTQKAVAEIWQAVLGVDRVGSNDNFFDLGGHSLHLVEVRERLATALGRDIPMTDLFRHSTPGKLAEFLSWETAEHSAFTESRDRARRKRERLAGRRGRAGEGQ